VTTSSSSPGLSGARLVAFDLDDTLAPSKSPLPAAIRPLIARLTQVVPVAVVSGGAFGQFVSQVIAPLAHEPGARIDRLHLMPACGTQYLRWSGEGWETIYAEHLDLEVRQRAAVALEEEARRLDLWSESTWGPIIEDRLSQVTFSALGQQAPIDEKAAWDPDGEKRARLRVAVADRLPDFEVRAGGSTSLDITRAGIDKGYGIRRLSEHTGVALDEMLFFGDQLFPGGNDHAVAALGVPVIAVASWHDTAAGLEALLESVA